jgi:adenylate kinase
MSTTYARPGFVAPVRLVLLGAPGAGKGTQATLLAATTGATHVSTGDLVRAAIAGGTPLGRAMQGYSDRGELVPDEVILQIVLPHLADPAGWILDGFPRDVAQAQALDAALAAQDMSLDRVIALQLADAMLIERLRDRRLSVATGRTYNLRFDPPPPDDPGPFVQRADDHPDEIRRRLQIYHGLTEPLLTYYADRGLLHTVDADGPAGVVQARLRAVLPAAATSRGCECSA